MPGRVGQLAVVVLLLAGVLALPRVAPPVFAANITVTTTVDEVTANGQCSLREAIRNANADAAIHPDCPAGAGPDTITLPAGTIAIALVGSNEDAALTGDFDLTSPVTIVGAGANTTFVDGGGFAILDRVFDVDPTGLGISATIESLTIRNALVPGGAGGGIRVAAGGSLTLRDAAVQNNESGYGGGILNRGTATVADTTFVNNRVFGGPNGGGIANEGTLTVTRALFRANGAIGGIIPSGGGFANEGGTASLTNVTIVENSVSNVGGGIKVSAGTTTLTNATVAQNGAGRGAQNIAVSGGTLSIRNTIVATNAGDNCQAPAGVLASLGNNLETGNTCTFNQVGDQINTNPLLGPVANNGGPTLTMALLAGSPAIDAGTTTGCPSTDQRSQPRPRDGDGNGTEVCDIGAYEAPSAPLVATLTPTPTLTPTATATGSATPGTATPTATITPTTTVTLVPTPKDDNKEDSPAKQTEEQRQQRERTNRSNRDDVRTEGNVVAVACHTSPPTVAIANRDGTVTVTLQGSAARACSAIAAGDYLEAEGAKEHEQLFHADEVDVSRR